MENRLAAPDAYAPDMNFGDYVERQAKDLGITVAELASEAKINPCTIYRWKTVTKRPYWDTFQRVHDVIRSHWDRRREREGA